MTLTQTKRKHHEYIDNVQMNSQYTNGFHPGLGKTLAVRFSLPPGNQDQAKFYEYE